MKWLKRLSRKDEGIPFKWVIITTIFLSVSMVSLSFIIFLRSGAYDTVKQIRVATEVLQDDSLSSVDTTSPINAEDIEEFVTSLGPKINAVETHKDFTIDAISEEALGF